MSRADDEGREGRRSRAQSQTTGRDEERLRRAAGAMPPAHRAFLERAIPVLAADARLVGVATGGSFLSGAMDEFSDVDLVVAVEPEAYDAVLPERHRIAAALGPLVAAFTGEHVGEPRLLICLYGPPLLHVDLKFVALADAAKRVEDPAILWQRERRLEQALAAGAAAYPAPDRGWIEDRFWVWVHYLAGKVGRGELFEAIDGLGFLRARVLGPLGLERAGAQPCGVRKVERLAPELAERLKETLAGHDAGECLRALRATIALYRELRPHPDGASRAAERAEHAAMDYLAEIERRCAGASGSRARAAPLPRDRA